ncbi:MAG TPA: PH domain-containing protein [Mycobacteriales bacterium]|nr:PH domain-containing protein [Mycobacteriales bacterium]
MADATTVQIRTSRIALLASLFGLSFATPLALASPWLVWVYLAPMLVTIWVVRAGVDVDTDGMTVRALVGSRRVPWSQVAGLEVDSAGRVRLVLAGEGGRAIRLPTARARHLPVIAAASGGHLTDPTAKPTP